MRAKIRDADDRFGGITIDIILDEYTWAEKKIREHDLGKRPSETICRLAKYYLYIGLSQNDAAKRIRQFMLECDPNIIIIDWEDTIARSVKNAKKYPLVILSGIPVTKTEVEKIDALGGRQLRRLAFTLLCIAKFRNAISAERCMWVNTPDKEIMKMANIHTSIKRQCLMFASLRDAGLIRFSKKVDNTSVEVLFADEEEPAFMVKDFRNLGYQYLMHCGENYFVCEECGITERCDANLPFGRKKKYCQDCAVKIRTRQNVDSVMRRRKKEQIAKM